ncbi:hypothetical protein Hanom_Chr10g00873071 [Helianthus anomalus]
MLLKDDIFFSSSFDADSVRFFTFFSSACFKEIEWTTFMKLLIASDATVSGTRSRASFHSSKTK